MSQTQIFLWCVVLIVLELNHLKWIWWTYWECGRCGLKHEHCARRGGCSTKWIMYL